MPSSFSNPINQTRSHSRDHETMTLPETPSYYFAFRSTTPISATDRLVLEQRSTENRRNDLVTLNDRHILC